MLNHQQPSQAVNESCQDGQRHALAESNLPAKASYDELVHLEIRIGTIIGAKPNERARKPMYILNIDFGAEIGIMTTSAMITENYADPAQLIGRQIAAATNMPIKIIAGVKSEVLLLAATDTSGSILLVPDKPTSVGVVVR